MAVSIQASKTGLEIVDQARIKKRWTKKASAWCIEAGNISTSTLDRFFERKSIKQESFVAICKAVGIEDWEAIAQTPVIKPNCYVRPVCYIYDPQTWVERKEENLLNRLQGQPRLLWITGISGIGKTILGQCLASKAWDKDPSFQWISLVIDEGDSPDFISVAAKLLAKRELGNYELSPQEQNNPDLVANRLIQKLQAQSFWIQFDSFEQLFQSDKSNEFVDRYWVTFFQRCLTENQFNSRFIITAQGLPTSLNEFCDYYENNWIEVRLNGVLDIDLQLEMFAKRGIIIDSTNQNILIQIAKIYEGHPLVLKVISEEILKDCAGDVIRYWQENQQEFERIAREIQASYTNKFDYTKALNRRVRERIKRSIQKIMKDALDLVCRSAVFRRPVPHEFWLAMVEELTYQQKEFAYTVLNDRALIETEGKEIRQHNLIRSVAYELLKNDSEIWRNSERQAAQLWLITYQPASDSPNLEKVRGYLEAIGHYYQIEDWYQVKEIFTNTIENSTKSTLIQQLDTWSYFGEELRLCQQILGKCGIEVDVKCWNNIGHASLELGNYPKSIEAYENSLRIAREIGDRKHEGHSLGNLGNAYRSIGEYDRAIDFHQQHLTVAREIGDKKGVGNALGNLGNVYVGYNKPQQALDFYEQQLKITRSIGDLIGEAKSLASLGHYYTTCTSEHQRSINFFNRSLEIFQKLGDLHSLSIVFLNLARAYFSLGDYQQAVNFFQECLTVIEEIGSSILKGDALLYLGNSHLNLRDYQQAISSYQKCLVLAEETSNSSLKATPVKVTFLLLSGKEAKGR